MIRRLVPVLSLTFAGVGQLVACGSDTVATAPTVEEPSSSASALDATTTVVILPTTVVVSSLAPAATTTSDTTVPATTVAVTEAPTTTAAPDALQTRPGTASVAVTVGGADPGRPTFTWPAVPGATGYELVVQDHAGRPIWAWTGADTTVVLGGAERDADAEGPTLDGSGRVRVYALDGSNALVGVSNWTPIGA